jgi:hypothetical protein
VRPSTETVAADAVPKGSPPESGRPFDIVDAERKNANSQHRVILSDEIGCPWVTGRKSSLVSG